VTLTGKQKFSVQARHGYYAPRTIKDPVRPPRRDSRKRCSPRRNERFCRSVCKTQFFKKDESQARLAVLTQRDVKGIRFRKATAATATI